jgi:DNA polymerase
MRHLGIDIETYSSVELPKAGVYAYAASPDFAILLFAYAFDADTVEVVDLASGEALPGNVLEALTDPTVVKTAYNAAFERVCIGAHLRRTLDPAQWRCTAVLAATQGLPGTLEKVGEVLGLSDEEKKLTTGRALIRFFCLPCEPTAKNGGRMRNLPMHDPAKWEIFKEYCARDVEAERTIRGMLERWTVPDDESALYALDQRINDTGVKVDTKLVQQAIRIDGAFRTRLEAEAFKLTGLDNPKSVAQLKGWLEQEDDTKVESLTKGSLPALIAGASSDTVRRVLELRQKLSKTSITKYAAMGRAVCPDGRIRGLLQFYGARTGRWAGRLVQVQNLPQNRLADLALARELVAAGDGETLEMLFGTPDTLSQLIRTALVPEPGSRFIVADFSAIEARVIAWLADEVWRMDVFRTHGKIYEASAAQMFRVPIESVTKGSDLRKKGKISELALGYGGGVNALVKMGAEKMGLVQDELPGLVSAWRKANPKIVKFWSDCENAAMDTVEGGGVKKLMHGIAYEAEPGMLFVRLPSGRRMAYREPRLINDARYSRPALVYSGVQSATKRWTDNPLYGGLAVENIVQAVARDCLAEALRRVDAAGLRICMHVHDEIIVEAPEGVSSAEELAEIMGRDIAWAPGLPLRADAYETPFYCKD